MALVPTLLDDDNPIAFDVEIPATRADISSKAVLQRIYIEGNTRGQNLRISLVFEDGTALQITDSFNTTGRGSADYGFATTRRWVAVRIESTGEGLTDIVEIFGVEVDVYVPTSIVQAQTSQEVGL